MTTDEENLVLKNINLAYKLASQYNNKLNGLLELDEIYSACLMGLTKAAKTFNSELNFKFSTYAYTIMKNEVLFSLKGIDKNVRTISLSTPQFDGDSELIDYLSTDINLEKDCEYNILLNDLRKAILELSERHKKVIQLRLKEKTFSEIGKILGISTCQAQQDYNKALNVLRSKLKNWR